MNKRSEAANRKYRAFIHFLKYQKKSGTPTEKGKRVANQELGKSMKDGPGGQGQGGVEIVAE